MGPAFVLFCRVTAVHHWRAGGGQKKAEGLVGNQVPCFAKRPSKTIKVLRSLDLLVTNGHAGNFRAAFESGSRWIPLLN